ncbi:Predicted kinase, aminoglycoside phosphotransferase (APT) family [Aliiroseovarius halocynthiae]|uniref:Phosphotransferase n=1 Tax=Aliiroseovarius halocynthiae TaxID=985055 RepID=A0A545SLQ6_9RHOB|nr:phosphotransferase [Aliiroseovarius halocynthiae]TQV65909.1 phosphotransferase [Aliiroseovarius halocynthiae]SMR83458.1 Predicted kinase, aminoglycoside phosphotransferase (APT) family [Aliiroseovarius halocynthiae]
MTLRDTNSVSMLPVHDHDALQRALALIWQEDGHVPEGAIWTQLFGGRSNPVWRITFDDARADLVCKLYDDAAVTPLFANDGTREALALKHLTGSGIAPDFVAFMDSALGASVLYRHIEGAAWRGDVKDVAILMARLHQTLPPEGLPETITSPVTLIAETEAMARAAKVDLPRPPAMSKAAPNPTRRFLHGDVVPGNIVNAKDGLRLIDWQCPSIGDPAADLAIFLSPAMQVLYGNRPLTAEERSAFLAAYEAAGGDAVGVARYKALAPLFHWRMACYCHWKTAQGDAAYGAVADLEIRASEQG